MASEGDNEGWDPLERPDYFWLAIASIHQVRTDEDEEHHGFRQWVG